MSLGSAGIHPTLSIISRPLLCPADRPATINPAAEFLIFQPVSSRHVRRVSQYHAPPLAAEPEKSEQQQLRRDRL